ncbi:MAG: ABC transporter permease [Acetivibrionales bacterium]|jgi:ribose/xylose/arabinose/galactoside ABC-type transport system permease subunit
MSKNKTKVRFSSRPEMLALAALVLLLIYNLFFTKGFFKIEIMDNHLYGVLIDIIKRGGPLMFLSMGMTLVIASGGTDISVGSIMAITGSIAATLIGGTVAGGIHTEANMPMLPAMAIALGVALVCGLWNGFLVAKLGIQPLIVTLMLQVAGRGIAELITSGFVRNVYYPPFAYFGQGWVIGLPFSIFVVVAVSIVVYLFTRKTAYGLYLESAGTNRVTAEFSGINVKAVIWVAYGVSGLMAGIAGLLATSEIRAAEASTLGLYLELDAIMACIIGGNSMKGGRFTLSGSLIGAILVQTLTTTIYMKGVPSETITVYKAIVLILVCLLQTTDMSKVFNKLRNSTKKTTEVAS